LLGIPDLNGKLTLRGKGDKIFSNFIAKKVDHLIVKSRQMKNHLAVKTPVSVIPNGVNFNVFRELDILETRKKLHFNKNDFVILFLGNKKILRKNFNLAHESVSLLKERIGSKNIKFVYPFGIDQSMVVEYMNAANVLLVTSFWEGSSNVVKEAMACNLPVISVDAGDAREILSGTHNCYIADYSKEEIFEKLKLIYFNRDRSNGREKIDHLRDHVVADKIFEIYRSLLTDNQSFEYSSQQDYKIKSSA
jgi:teichuronic acid biosynthesis glycosyltransferase TuaC